MSNEFDFQSELERLFAQQQAEGGRGPASIDIAKLLSKYPEALDAYLDHCNMEAMLRESYGLLNLEGATRGVGGESVNAPSRPTRRGQYIVQVSAIAMGLAAVLMLAFWLQERDPIPDANAHHASTTNGSGAEVGANSPPLVRRPAEPLASIQQSVGVSLHETGYGPLQVAKGNRIGAGNFQLRQGVLELLFGNGAVVILQAPVQFQTDTDNHILVSQGRMTVRCETPESKGFSVETPSGVAIDLGTEFAVDVSPSGKSDDEFHVFSGKVLLRPKADVYPGKLPLKEGQASRLDHLTATPAGIDVDYQRFIRGFLGDSDDYQKEVMALDPVSYFPMTPNQDGRTVPNAVQNQPSAMVRNNNADHMFWASGFNGGTSLNMDGVHSGTYAIAEDFPKATGDETSVVAWVYAESRSRWGSIAKNWQHGADHVRRGQFHFGLHLDTGALGAQINDNDNVEQTVMENIPLPLFRWQHVAMVVEETHLRIFRNGEQVAAQPCNGLNGNPKIKPLAIGTKLGNQSLMPAVDRNGFWDGCIDHVAVYNKALTSDQIRHLYGVGILSMEDFRGSP